MKRPLWKKDTKSPPLNFPSGVAVTVERVLWEGAKFYARMHQKEHPSAPLTHDQRALIALLSFEPAGLAVRYTAPNGDITFKATPKCPGRDECPDGFVTFSMTHFQ